MDARKFVLPAVALMGGALLGRLIGVRGLMRAGVAALTVANVSKSAGLLTAGTDMVPAKPAQRAARKRPAQRKSPRKTAPRSRPQTH
jgi:hypothetical protein